MASKPRQSRAQTKVHPTTTAPDDSSPGDPGSASATEQTIQIPVIPTHKIEIYPLNDQLAWVVLGNVLAEGKFTLDRGQLHGLGAALIKAANAMSPTKQLEVVSGLATP